MHPTSWLSIQVSPCYPAVTGSLLSMESNSNLLLSWLASTDSTWRKQPFSFDTLTARPRKTSTSRFYEQSTMLYILLSLYIGISVKQTQAICNRYRSQHPFQPSRLDMEIDPYLFLGVFVVVGGLCHLPFNFQTAKSIVFDTQKNGSHGHLNWS